MRVSGARASTRCVVSIPSMPPGSSRSCSTTCGRHSSSRSSSSSPVVAIPTSLRSAKDSRYACRLRPTTRWSSTIAIVIGMSRERVEEPHVEPHSSANQSTDHDEYHDDTNRDAERLQKIETEVVGRPAEVVGAAEPVEQETDSATG